MLRKMTSSRIEASNKVRDAFREQAAGEALLRAAGASATAAAPLAWLRLEGDDEDRGAGLRLAAWPGGADRLLARGDFPGRWIEWRSRLASGRATRPAQTRPGAGGFGQPVEQPGDAGIQERGLGRDGADAAVPQRNRRLGSDATEARGLRR